MPKNDGICLHCKISEAINKYFGEDGVDMHDVLHHIGGVLGDLLSDEPYGVRKAYRKVLDEEIDGRLAYIERQEGAEGARARTIQ